MKIVSYVTKQTLLDIAVGGGEKDSSCGRNKKHLQNMNRQGCVFLSKVNDCQRYKRVFFQMQLYIISVIRKFD